MEPYPEELKKKIMELHPELTDPDFGEYLRLINEAHLTDPLEFPEQRKRAEEELADFTRTNLPRLEEAHATYAENMKKHYEDSIEPTLRSPVDIALEDENVGKWLQERSVTSGAYTIDCRVFKEPHIYMVEFKFKDRSTLQVSVDRQTMDVDWIFKRVVNQPGSN